MLHSEGVANLTKALVAAQGAFGIARKGTENPFFNEYQKLGFGKDEIFGIFDAVTGRKDPERMTQENIDSLRRDLDLRKKCGTAAASGNEGRERIAQQKGAKTGIGEIH